MSRIARNLAKTWAIATFLAVGCGGRTADSNNPDDGTDSPDSGTDKPAPTCGDICRRAVDLCFPGAATEQCTRDCEGMRSLYKGCDGLDTFLKCRLMSAIRCSTNQVTFDGCTDELNHLVRCHS